MKELLVLSGKGGTGKTSLVGALSALIENKVLVDCDVDAPDLHLILQPVVKNKNKFISGVKAKIDFKLCSNCGQCFEICQFDAIVENGQVVAVDELSCEGCGVCARFCPEDAIELEPNHCGYWYVSDTSFGPLVHAELLPGEENTGKLVALVKKEARILAERHNKALMLVDGPPGIGCPVISSISGVDFIIIVTEPTLSGLHDLERVSDLASHFKVNHGVVVNKWDLNPEISGQIQSFCNGKGISFLGMIPFDENILLAHASKKNLMEFKHCKAGESIANIWLLIEKKLQEGKK